MESLRIGIAPSNPPFCGAPDGEGLDIDLMTELARVLGTEVRFIEYRGADFNGIFDELSAGAYDCVAAGATVTPELTARAAFAPPYLISGQALAVDTARFPEVRSVQELAGRTIGVQRGRSGVRLAERLVAEGAAAAVKTYDHGDLAAALADLSTGGCDAVLELAPVLTAASSQVSGIDVVQRQLTTEDIAIAVRPDDQRLLGRLTVAQAELEDAGTLQRLRRKWVGNPYTDQHLAAH
ncbi:ABC transporter substrate-binding protein [Mycolicibacterium thermoresistibile]